MPDHASITLPHDGFSNIDSVAGFFDVSRSTIYRWVGARRFPRPLKLGQQAVRWRNADLHAWAADPAGWHDDHGDAQHA